MQFSDVTQSMQNIQARIVCALEEKEKKHFVRESWCSSLGTGLSIHLGQGHLFERAGVNYSEVESEQLPHAATLKRPQLSGLPYRACGVSLVLHPLNPYCPTVHMNIRYFESEQIWWFGGGMDLTPYYGYLEDCHHFHKVCSQTLEPYGKQYYPAFKTACDDYFYLPHRQQTRGIGGIFFDDLNTPTYDHTFALVKAVGDSFLSAYMPILERRQATPYGNRQQQWQHYRRSRYVEFNLVYDRGTLFGLQSGGRADSILMSLPPTVRWLPPLQLTAAELALESDFLLPRDWLAADSLF